MPFKNLFAITTKNIISLRNKKIIGLKKSLTTPIYFFQHYKKKKLPPLNSPKKSQPIDTKITFFSSWNVNNR
jgi:hypothetical protein